MGSPEELLSWYAATFVPDPERGYAQMNPCGADAKYSRKTAAVKTELIGGGLTGATRRLQIDGRWQTFPLSIAVVPATRDGWAHAAIVEIDYGGRAAVQRTLDMCRAHGFWAFAQLGTSTDHDGGHVYIPSSQPQAASFLQSIAARVQACAGVQGEAYPNGDHDLRLPLMTHLRAPGGPERFPLLLQSGELVDAGDVWEALTRLRQVWHPTSAESFTAAVNTLPSLSVHTPQPLHKSKVNQLSGTSVIRWFNENYDLADLLAGVGVHDADRRHVVRCPWHDDRSPSLVLWKHGDTHRLVCRCYSANSGCVAADVKYLDSFNVYCMIEHLTPSEAVKRLAEEHGLGRKREMRTCEAATSAPCSLEQHARHIAEARKDLEAAVRRAIKTPGRVTVLRATPGLGKTHVAAAIANEQHVMGKTVAIVAPSHAHAAEEWASRLCMPYIWEARTRLCTCYPRAELEELTARGYALPDCEPGCPYQAQYTKREGRQTIYQYHHLHLNDGELLAGADVVIIDESPMAALLEERAASQEDIRLLGNRRDTVDQPDPATPLLRALWHVSQAYPPQQRSLRGPALVERLREAVSIPLEQAIAEARTSPYARRQMKADGQTEAHKLPKLFLGRLLDALDHDAQPGQHNSRLAWDGRAWLWYELHPLMSSAYGKLTAPAVLVLDGSADRQVCERLYATWPVEIVTIDAPLSPAVRIVQCPVTASTRKIVQDDEQLQRLIRAVAVVCQHQGVTLDGGISYMAATERIRDVLGGEWLHYGNQRGINSLAAARTLAIVASPTAPPDAIERKALALWGDAAPIDCTWEKVGQGDYRACDARLQAMADLHGPEELRQAAHRCRPILSNEQTTLLVFTPWNLAPLGLSPSVTITEIPHGNSKVAQASFDAYRAAVKTSADTVPQQPVLQENCSLQNGVVDQPYTLNRIVNRQILAADGSPPYQLQR